MGLKIVEEGAKELEDLEPKSLKRAQDMDPSSFVTPRKVRVRGKQSEDKLLSPATPFTFCKAEVVEEPRSGSRFDRLGF